MLNGDSTVMVRTWYGDEVKLTITKGCAKAKQYLVNAARN